MGADDESKITFNAKDLAGSRLACLALTSGADAQVAVRLSRLVGDFGRVESGAKYMPRGLLASKEARLSVRDGLHPVQRPEVNSLRRWWLWERGNVPNWDIAAECVVSPPGRESRPGLLLVEAKAHHGELDPSGKSPDSSLKNHQKIGDAIEAANQGLKAGWALSRDKCYQLSNRFAWGWKLASLKIPVILVYLGVLGAEEMRNDARKPFDTEEQWSKAIREHAMGLVPDVWETCVDVEGTALIPLIRTVCLDFLIR